MKSSFLNEQRIIQTSGNILWIMQFTRNISMDNEQYIQRTITQRNIGELHGQFCYTNKDNKGIRIKDNLIFKNSRETQPVFQKIKM